MLVTDSPVRGRKLIQLREHLPQLQLIIVTRPGNELEELQKEAAAVDLLVDSFEATLVRN